MNKNRQIINELIHIVTKLYMVSNKLLISYMHLKKRYEYNDMFKYNFKLDKIKEYILNI